jgi:hypothetical protein
MFIKFKWNEEQDIYINSEKIVAVRGDKETCVISLDHEDSEEEVMEPLSQVISKLQTQGDLPICYEG